MKATDIHFKTPGGTAEGHYVRGHVLSEEEGNAVFAVLAIVLSAPLPVVIRQMSPDGPHGPIDMLSGDYDGIVSAMDALFRAKQIAAGVRQ